MCVKERKNLRASLSYFWKDILGLFLSVEEIFSAFHLLTQFTTHFAQKLLLLLHTMTAGIDDVTKRERRKIDGKEEKKNRREGMDI